MYVPWSLEDAADKLLDLVDTKHKNAGKISDWTNGTIDRCIDIMEGHGNKWLRQDSRYRDNIVGSKF